MKNLKLFNKSPAKKRAAAGALGGQPPP